MRLRELLVTIALFVLSGSATSQEIAARLDTGGRDWVHRTDALEVLVEPVPDRSMGRLAILIGTTDMTELFRHTGRGLQYRPELIPLPAGETEIIAYLVSPDGEWREIGRMPLRVLTTGGFERVQASPRLDIQGKGQFDENHSPAENAPIRSTFEDATAQADFRVDLERSGWTLSNQANIVGVTNIEEALRFGQRGPEADKIDLSNYSIRAAHGKGFLELGHVFYGEQQHLISGFSSRGVVLELPLGRHFVISGTAMNGTSIVGWDNILGLERRKHRIESAGIGFELLPDRPGALRIDGTFVDGSLLPLSNFNQGDINDAETSEGWAVRLRSSSAGQRIRLDAGLATSQFDNPFDPLLAPDGDLVAVEEEERNASFGRLHLGILQGHRVSETLQASLNLSLQYERVEPQYRSVAAFVQADQERKGADLTFYLGALSLQAGHSTSKDNLDEIASILTTKTRTTNVSANLALQQMFASENRSYGWLPILSYFRSRTHQFGVGVPINGGFDPSHVPDQVSDNHTASLQWQGGFWSFGYQMNYSDQDNRQPGRERNDFTGLNHGLNFSVSPHQRIDIGLDLSRERAFSVADHRIDRNRRYGVNLSLRVTDRMLLGGNYSFIESENEPKTNESENTSFNAEWSYRIENPRGDRHGTSTQLFLRYFDQAFLSRDTVFGFNVDNSSSTINGGLSLSFH